MGAAPNAPVSAKGEPPPGGAGAAALAPKGLAGGAAAPKGLAGGAAAPKGLAAAGASLAATAAAAAAASAGGGVGSAAAPKGLAATSTGMSNGLAMGFPPVFASKGSWKGSVFLPVTLPSPKRDGRGFGACGGKGCTAEFRNRGR